MNVRSRKTGLTFCLLLFVIMISSLSQAYGATMQKMNITGKVVDSNDSPVIGVNISVKGTNTSTVSDIDGKYSISADMNSTLSVSYIGYKSIEEKVTKPYMILKLAEDTKGLDEVIVVGYGTQKKSDITGSVVVIKENLLRQIPAGNIATALQGMGAGVDIVKSGGNNHPASTPQIRIRGSRSLNASNDPLIVLDGIPFDGSLNDVAPDDIVGVQILKDASSTAIYGSRGANGVILINTKKGKNEKPTVTYNGYAGFNESLGNYDLMDAEQFHQFKKWAYLFSSATGTYTGIDDPKLNDGIFISDAASKAGYLAGVNTNWQDLIYQTGLVTNHQVGISGGSEKTQYAASLGYYGAEGNYAAYNFDRYNLKMSIDQQIGKYVKMGLNTLASVSLIDGESVNPMGSALQASPLLTPYKEDGSLWVELSTSNVYNPILDYQEGAIIDEQKRLSIFTTGYMEIDLTHGLKYKLNAGIQFDPNKSGKFYGSETTKQQGGYNYSYNQAAWGCDYTVENLLTYDQTFAKNHHISFTGLYSIQEKQRENTYTHASDLFYDNAWYHNNGYANGSITSNGDYTKWDIISYMGRLNYNFMDRYLATVTVRSDGSSRLAEGHKWGLFPSGALAWNIANENFMDNIDILSTLKLRASYGTVGNTAISAYATQGDLTTRKYNFGTTNAIGVYPDDTPNYNLSWEKTSSLNAAVDFGLWDNRLNGSVEYYHQYTSDLLMRQSLPATTGTNGSFLQNVGKTENQGVELNLTSVNVNGNGKNTLNWTTDFNIYFNRSKITQLASGALEDKSNAWFVGESLNVVYGYKRVGIWQNTPEDIAEATRLGLTTTGTNTVIGCVRVADYNDDDKINADDRTIIGTRVPKFEGGITNRLAWKNIDFALVANFRVGGLLYSAMHDGWMNTFQATYNNLDVDYWTLDNPSNYWPKAHSGKQSPDYRSTLCYFDATYLKIRSISLGYTIPEKLLSKVGAKNFRIYTTVSNPFVFFSDYVNNYGGLDPETSGNMDLNTPACWSMIFGLNFSF